jgi:hypothetical protein
MGHYTGLTGAVYVPTGVGDHSAITFAEIGATGFYVIQQESDRITHAFTDAAVIGDFTPAAGAMVSLIAPTGTLEISGAGATVAVTSANSRVYTMAKIGGFHEFTLDTETELLDVTEFEDPWRVFEKSVTGFSAVCQRHWRDENFAVDVAATMQAITGGKFPVEFFLDRTSGARFRFVGEVFIEEYSAASGRSGAVAHATINMRGNGQLYYRNEDN